MNLSNPISSVRLADLSPSPHQNQTSSSSSNSAQGSRVETLQITNLNKRTSFHLSEEEDQKEELDPKKPKSDSIERRVTRATTQAVTRSSLSIASSSSSSTSSLSNRLPKKETLASESLSKSKSPLSSSSSQAKQDPSKRSVRELSRNFRQICAKPSGVHTVEFQTICNQYIGEREISPKEMEKYENQVREKGLTHGLHLCEIDKSTVGSGIFLDPHAPLIKSDTFLGLYAGKMKITTENTESESAYLLTLQPEVELTQNQVDSLSDTYSDKGLYYLDIDANKEGNFTRYFNESGSADKCNVIYKRVWVPSIKMLQIGFFSSKPIHPGEQALITYGKKYWESYKSTGLVPTPMTPTTYVLNKDYQVVKGSR